MTCRPTTTHGMPFVQISLLMENCVGSFSSVVTPLGDVQIKLGRFGGHQPCTPYR